jgi:hypothetical protein
MSGVWQPTQRVSAEANLFDYAEPQGGRRSQSRKIKKGFTENTKKTQRTQRKAHKQQFSILNSQFSPLTLQNAAKTDEIFCLTTPITAEKTS